MPSDQKDALESRYIEKTEAVKLYPSPKKDSIFKARWENFITSLYGRSDFNEGILFQLEVLCDLYVELNALNNVIKEKGYTFVRRTQYGDTDVVRPEVPHKNKVLAEIRQYSNMLGLLISKKGKSKVSDEEEDDWD